MIQAPLLTDNYPCANMALLCVWAQGGHCEKAYLFLICLLTAFVYFLARPAFAETKVYTAELSEVVDPSMALFIQRAIKEAQAADAQALVIVMNTPGGLVESAREFTPLF